ncbi:hypothetical protein GWI33_015755 [Rhynchophorus ferrugineus]|uniref:Uncharacterized protein n=1 Tax=Rhynchophorus ferrugineus TaxID=354439 RepID=A0A834HZC6_RHYFE|nr:hypothetical protein GWI33_015755 [Rhynchophorus ferrugineus]
MTSNTDPIADGPEVEPITVYRAGYRNHPGIEKRTLDNRQRTIGVEQQGGHVPVPLSFLSFFTFESFKTPG